MIEHVVTTHFLPTLSLKPEDSATRHAWNQEFETTDAAERLRTICEPANEENLNRLETVLGIARH